MLLIFVTKGTRGDVQPAAVLAHALQQSNQADVHFLTHAAHKVWLQELLIEAAVKVVYLDSLPARVWTQQEKPHVLSHKRKADDLQHQTVKSFQSRDNLEECLAAILQILELAAAVPVQVAQRQPQSSLIVFNLFSLEALHLAEAVKVPCIAISPCLVPYSCPSALQRRFEKTWPTLYHSLCHAQTGQVSWSEVEHWLWPLFSRTWASCRQQRLSLPAVPFQHHTSGPSDRKNLTSSRSVGNSRSSSTSSSSSSSSSKSHSNDDSSNSSSCSKSGSSSNSSSRSSRSGDGSSDTQTLTPSIPLLYGLSESVIQRPGYWPSSVHCCGFWQQQGYNNDRVRRQQLQTHLDKVLPCNGLEEWQKGQRLVCIDFGSMGSMGLIPGPTRLVSMLSQVLIATNTKGILLTGGWQPLAEAAAASGDDQHRDLWIVTDSVPHHLLLPSCDAIIHHGGAGTSAAALTAGIPQLVCPFHFDQFQWAERLAWLGVACQYHSKHLVSPSQPSLHAKSSALDCTQQQQVAPSASTAAAQKLETSMTAGVVPDQCTESVQQLIQQLQVVLSGRFQQQCQALQQKLHAEDGIATAVKFIAQYANKAAVPCKDAVLRLRDAKANATHAADEDQHASDDIHASTSKSPLQDAVEEVQLPNGWSVPALSASEAMFIYTEIVEQQCYMQEGIKINDGDIIMDVGANIGLFSWWVMQGAPGRGVPAQVWALEPMPANLARLQANLKLSDLTQQVQVFPAAVGAEVGQRQFRYYPAMPGNSTCQVKEKEQLQKSIQSRHYFADAEDLVCPVTSVSALMESHGIQRIDLMKVDAEGYEWQVLQGIKSHHWPNIKQIVMEVHDTEGRLAQITEKLQAEGFVVVSKPGFVPETYLVYASKHSGKHSRFML